MNEFLKLAGIVLLGLTAGACASTGPQDGAVAAPPGTNAASAPNMTGAPPARTVAAAGVSKHLDDEDRAAMADAEAQAFESGARRPWRGKRAYGYIEPGQETTDLRGRCREYTQRIYVEGRPRLAQGVACRGADGAWRAV